MIVVTGATGNVGSALVRQLSVAGNKVRALTRDASRAVVPLDAEVVEADLTQPESLDAAFAGAERLFLLTTGGADASHVLEAAGRAGIRHVVLVSSLLAQTHPESFIGRSSLANEQAARDSGLAWTALRPWEFASNVLAWAPQIRDEGVVRTPASGLPSPSVHPSDIAEVGAAALTGDGHEGATYPLTGPQELLPSEKVAALSQVLGRDIHFEEQHDPEALDELGRQAPDETTKGLMIPGVCLLESPGVLPTVRDVTGAPGRSFQQWARENADAFR